MRDSFDPEWLSITGVAQKSDLCYKTVWRAVNARELRAYRHGERGSWRVRIQDYDAWMNSRVARRRSA